MLLFWIVFLAITVFANTIFEIDEAFFTNTGISSWDYSPLHFNYGGNNFDGIMFWWTGSSNTGTLELSGTTIECNKQLEWLYINTARWNRVWPLDEATLLELSWSTTLSWYESLTMTGWFFTQCTGVWISGDGIFGYVEHEYEGNTYNLWAWVEYDLSAWTATWIFNNTLTFITGANNTASGYLFDTYGGIASVYSNQELFGDINFTWSEVVWSGDMSSYVTTETWIQVRLYANQNSEFEISGDVLNTTTWTITASTFLDEGIILTSNTWNKEIIFTVNTGWNNFVDTISVILLESGSTSTPPTTDTTPPTVTLQSPSNGATISVNNVTLQWTWSDDVAIDDYDLYLSWNSTTMSWNDISWNSQIVNPLSNNTYEWRVVATDTSGNTWQSSTRSFIISGSAATPTLLNPTNWANIDLWNLELSWTGVSASGYTWQIASDSSFANLVATGETDSTSIDPVHNEDFMTWTFYWRVIDDETTWVSDHRAVNIVEPSEWLDLEVDEFDFDEIDDAEIWEFYQSNEITIDGITNNVYIPIELEDSIWALFINDIMVGSNWLVKKWDNVYIELISSNDYDDRSQTILIVWEWDDQFDARFRIYTMDNDGGNHYQDWEFYLSYTLRLQAIMLLDSLVSMYWDNTERLEQFLTTFQAILQDKSDLLDSEIDNADSDNELELLRWQKASVDYLYSIIDDYLRDMSHDSSTRVYIAPNGKQYTVYFDENRFAYTSPDFMYPKYFPTWERFTYHIDINNPGSYSGSNYHSSTNGIGEIVTAPNNKTYQLYQSNGKWTSDDFSYKRYFDTKEQTIDYIFANNPWNTRDHRIDTNFDPVSFVAQNGKRYSIFKTSSNGNNPNKYSSFSFVTPKYFGSLQAVKDHIVIYNR